MIPGATRPSRIAEDTAALNETVPTAFRTELRAAGPVSPVAPLPNNYRAAVGVVRYHSYWNQYTDPPTSTVHATGHVPPRRPGLRDRAVQGRAAA